MSATPINHEETQESSEDEPLLEYTRGFRRATKTKRKFPKCCSRFCLLTLIICVIFNALMTILAGASYHFINAKAMEMAVQEVALTKDGQTLDKWSTPPAPVHMIFYLFNLTNADEFLNNGSKPIVKEIGPFYYNENKTKFDLIWNEDETILRYNESCIYTYIKKHSCELDPVTTNITTLNLPLMGLLVQLEKLENMIDKLPEPLRKDLKDFCNILNYAIVKEFSESLFMTRTVDEIIFGYQDPLLKFLSDLNIHFLPIPENGVFGLKERAGFAGPNMVYTGKYDSKTTARYLMSNGQLSNLGWGTPYASMLNGTEGVLFHPGLKHDDVLYVFDRELFRSGYFRYHEDVTMYGIESYKFTLPPEELKRANQDPGFFMNAPDGVLNLTAVYPLNVPVFASKPHFLDADNVYREYLSNESDIKPDRDRHDTFCIIEPITGLTLHGEKRLQINIQLEKTGHLTEFENLPNITYLPILWAEEGGQLNSSQADEFKKQVYLPLEIIWIGSIGAIASGGVMTVVHLIPLLIIGICKCKKK